MNISNTRSVPVHNAMVDNNMSIYIRDRFISGNYNSEFYIRPLMVIYQFSQFTAQDVNFDSANQTSGQSNNEGDEGEEGDEGDEG